ncbi:MAG: class I SAM-dependent methyltransferase [Planctomycetota bacterium]
MHDPRIEQLLRRGDEIWREYCDAQERFHRVIPADHALAVEALTEHRARKHSFLELGAATGVITILADLLGYDAWGIEIEPDLVQTAEGLAREVGSGANFVEGSFVPMPYRDEVELLDAEILTPTEGDDAYAEMGRTLADFDLVYAYPWPGEEDWQIEMVRRFGGPQTELLMYTLRDGFEIV